MPQEIRRREKEDRIASYTFTDLLTGKTYIHYYGSSNGEAIGSKHLLTGFVHYSEDTETAIPVSTTTAMDFDSPVTSTFVVDGTAVYSCSVTKRTAGAFVTVSGSVVRERDGIETDLGEVEIGKVLVGDASDDYRLTGHGSLDKTRFKNGDILRLRLNVQSGAATTPSDIYHDPKNRQGALGSATKGSTLDVFIPFNVNV